ncbi:MAG: response regulator transcription factor [Bacteroidota bacterium]
MKKIKVILVDDHQIVRDGIKSLLGTTASIEVIGEAGDGYELMDLLKNTHPDLVLMDINLPKISGIETTKLVRHNYPGLKILMLSMYTSEDFIFNAIKAGVNGYLEKNTTKKELQTAIQEIFHGNEYYSRSISETILKGAINRTRAGAASPAQEEKPLTVREKEILQLVIEGISNPEISEKLFISIRTVETHKTNIMRKLGVSNMVDLVKFAIKNKLVNL